MVSSALGAGSVCAPQFQLIQGIVGVSAPSYEKLTERLQEGLQAALAAVIASLQGISEEEAHQIPEPDEWTVAQLLAHIAEIQGFWMEKALLITKENDPQITRTAVENDLRIAAVEDHSQGNVADLLARVSAANEKAIATTASIDPKDLDRPGHREDNPMTVAGGIEYIAGHVKLHADQIIESRRVIKEKVQDDDR